MFEVSSLRVCCVIVLVYMVCVYIEMGDYVDVLVVFDWVKGILVEIEVV